MKDHVRAAVAYVVGRVISGKQATAVYDYTSGGYRSMSGTFEPQRVNAYDHVAGCYLSGNGNGRGFNLHHYGENQPIRLDVDGETFRGHDYGTNTAFSGKVTGNSVSVYDYEHNAYFSYSV